MRVDHQSEHRLVLGWVLGFIGVAIFGGTLPATTLALQDFPPWFITFARALIAAVCAGLTLLILRRPWPREALWRLSTAGLLLTIGFPGLMAIAMQTVPASHGGVVLGILPLLTALCSALVTGERPSLLFWLCGVAGALIVIWFSVGGSALHLSQGEFWLFLAGLCAALGYVISGDLSAKMPGWEVICWILVLMAPFSLLGSLLHWDNAFLQPQTAPLLALLYLALFSMFLGFFAWNVGMAMGGIAQVGQIQLLQPFFTLGFAYLLLGEPISWRTIAFAGAVILVVWLGKKTRVARK